MNEINAAERVQRIEYLKRKLNVDGEIRQLYEMYSAKFIHAEQDHRWKHFYDAIEGAYICGMKAGEEIERDLIKEGFSPLPKS
jgi:hypothetical protein